MFVDYIMKLERDLKRTRKIALDMQARYSLQCEREKKLERIAQLARKYAKSAGKCKCNDCWVCDFAKELKGLDKAK